MKLPMTRAGRKMARQDSGAPCTFWFINKMVSYQEVYLMNLTVKTFLIRVTAQNAKC